MSGGSRHVAAHPERLAGLLEPVVSAAGLELESVRVGRAGRRSLLRVVVDTDQGVSLDDIALVSRAVAAGAAGVTLEVDGERREFGYAELGPGQVQVEFKDLGVQPDGH